MSVSNVLTVADDILKLAKRDGKEITPLQLMKLVYISHGWCLAIHNKDLFSDTIQAWKYGPIIPNLYRATKAFDGRAIPLTKISDSALTISGVASDIIRQVWNKYGGLSDYTLSKLTHEDNAPWSLVYSDTKYYVKIDNELIRHYYLGLLSSHTLA
jgi:uncharacterized phage-associated protein